MTTQKRKYAVMNYGKSMDDIGKSSTYICWRLVTDRKQPKKIKLIGTPIKEVKRSFDLDDMKVNVEKEVEAATNENDLTVQFQALYNELNRLGSTGMLR